MERLECAWKKLTDFLSLLTVGIFVKTESLIV